MKKRIKKKQVHQQCRNRRSTKRCESQKENQETTECFKEPRKKRELYQKVLKDAPKKKEKKDVFKNSSFLYTC
jgi:hypothetical protein